MSFTPTCLNRAIPQGSCMSEGFVSSLGKPSASKCSCLSWPLGDKGAALLHFLFCTSNSQSPLPPAELHYLCKGNYSQIRASGNGGTSCVLTTTLRRRGGKRLSRAQCLLCLPSPVLAQRKEAFPWTGLSASAVLRGKLEHLGAWWSLLQDLAFPSLLLRALSNLLQRL